MVVLCNWIDHTPSATVLAGSAIHGYAEERMPPTPDTTAEVKPVLRHATDSHGVQRTSFGGAGHLSPTPTPATTLTYTATKSDDMALPSWPDRVVRLTRCRTFSEHAGPTGDIGDGVGEGDRERQHGFRVRATPSTWRRGNAVPTDAGGRRPHGSSPRNGDAERRGHGSRRLDPRGLRPGAQISGIIGDDMQNGQHGAGYLHGAPDTVAALAGLHGGTSH